MAVPATVVYFTMYDQLRDAMMKKYSLTYQPMWIPAVAGGLSRSKFIQNFLISFSFLIFYSSSISSSSLHLILSSFKICTITLYI